MVRPPTVPVPLPRGLFYGWVIVAMALVVNLASAPLNPVMFSFFLAPMTEDLDVSRGALSLALTFRFAATGVTGPFIGLLIDRMGSQWLGVLAGLVAGGSIAGLAFLDSLWPIYVLFAISGAVGLGGGPGGNLLATVTAAKWFIVKRGRAMAIVMVGLAGGTVIAIPIAQWLIQSLGWREAWLIFGATLAALVVPASAIFLRRSPEDLGLHPDGVEQRVTSEAGAAGHDPERNPEVTTQVDWTVGEALRTPALWLILAALALAGLSLSGTLVHRVAYWEETGMSPGLVAAGTAADPFTVIFSALAFGFIGERVHSRYLGVIAGTGFAVSMLPMIFTGGQAYTIFAHGITWGASAGAFITVNNLIWPNYFGRAFLGTIRGVVLPVSVAANGLGAPLYGYLIDTGMSQPLLWTVSLGLFALAGVLLLAARPPRHRSAKPATG